MPKKYKVSIDRDQCIADMACTALCPDVFEMNEEDGKAQIVEKYRKSKESIKEGIVPENLKSCVEEAANACPVQIIHVEEVEE